jgi:hypothetical protein
MKADSYDFDALKARRNSFIKLYKSGLTLQAIGDSAGLSRERVRQIISRPLLRRKVEVKDCRICGSLFKEFEGALYCEVCRPRLEGRERTRWLVRLRDGLKCRACDVKWKEGSRAFDVHHLKGLCGKRSRKYDSVKAMDDLVTLCHKCHLTQHITRRRMRTAKTKNGGVDASERLGRMRSMRAEGNSFDAIAKNVGLSQARVWQILKKAH